jgi:hypothetical protein
MARDPTEVLKFYASNPRRRRQSSFGSHSGLRLRQCPERTRGWAGEATQGYNADRRNGCRGGPGVDCGIGEPRLCQLRRQGQPSQFHTSTRGSASQGFRRNRQCAAEVAIRGTVVARNSTEQYPSANSSMVWRYPGCASGLDRLSRTADLAILRFGNRRTYSLVRPFTPFYLEHLC